MILSSFPLTFCLFCSVSDRKSCFSIKKSILTSEWRAEHPFAGQNRLSDAHNLILKSWMAFLLLCLIYKIPLYNLLFGEKGRYMSPRAVYFDQLEGAGRTWMLVKKLYFFAILRHFSSFEMFFIIFHQFHIFSTEKKIMDAKSCFGATLPFQSHAHFQIDQP